MRCLYLLLSNCAFLRNTTPQEKNSWRASLGGSQREVLKREECFETNNDYIFLLNNLLFAYDNFSDVYFNLRYKFSKFSILCSFYRRLFCNFQFSSLTQLYIAFE